MGDAAWILESALREKYKVGCTDHGCVFGHPGGMGTNGGCHCLEEIHGPHRAHVSAYIRELRRRLIDAAKIKEDHGV